MVIGLLLSAACLGSAWYINRLQASQAYILSNNVTSLRAAQGLEISLRQLRFYCFTYLVAPDEPPDPGQPEEKPTGPTLKEKIARAEKDFEAWLQHARDTANTPEEWEQIHKIENGYRLYQKAFDDAEQQVKLRGPFQDLRKLAQDNPAEPIVGPCHKLFSLNERVIADTSQENARLSQKLHLVLLFLALGGPVSGLIMGYGLARGWSRSIHRLSVQVQGMAQRLDQDVAWLKVGTGGDLSHLDRQLEYVVGRVEEVVERLQHQQREMLRAQQLTAVGQLAASVAHEVRNPLTAIKMLVEAALRSRNARPFTEENLRVVHAEVVRLERTVQGFLNFARPPALCRSQTDLREIVNWAVELVRARARQQHVQLDVATPAEPVYRDVDGDQLCTVLVNLFINALDAMPTGGRLEVALDAAAGAARLQVRDSGPGIAPEMSGRLFTPFASTKATGTGLGLSISRRVIEDHGGRIVCAPPNGRGACFTITLPEG